MSSSFVTSSFLGLTIPSLSLASLPMSTDKHTPPPQEWFDSPRDRPADVILAVADLKRLAVWLVGTLVGFGGVVICAVAAYFNSEIKEQRVVNSSQGMIISSVANDVQSMKSQWQRLEDSIDRAQDGQQVVLVQIAELRAKASSTEEIARSTNERLETLARYMRENSVIHLQSKTP